MVCEIRYVYTLKRSPRMSKPRGPLRLWCCNEKNPISVSVHQPKVQIREELVGNLSLHDFGRFTWTWKHHRRAWPMARTSADMYNLYMIFLYICYLLASWLAMAGYVSTDNWDTDRSHGPGLPLSPIQRRHFKKYIWRWHCKKYTKTTMKNMKCFNG
jgi:hypothetical protein